MIWIIYAFGWDRLTVQPEDHELVVSYKVFKEDNTPTKNGMISISSSDHGVTLARYQSLKKKTLQYLDQYDQSISSLSKVFVDELKAEL